MGIAIHYHGGLDDRAQLEAALTMLREECDQQGWPYRLHDFSASGNFKTCITRSIPSDLPVVTETTAETHTIRLDTRWRGLIIQPHPETESPVLMFDPQTGRLMMLMDVPDGRFLTYQLSIKTQFAPIEIHVAVCEVLHRLQTEFGQTQLPVYDEGGHFDTGDTDLLRRAPQQIDESINNLDMIARLTRYAAAGDEVQPPTEEQLAGRLN